MAGEQARVIPQHGPDRATQNLYLHRAEQIANRPTGDFTGELLTSTHKVAPKLSSQPARQINRSPSQALTHRQRERLKDKSKKQAQTSPQKQQEHAETSQTNIAEQRRTKR